MAVPQPDVTIRAPVDRAGPFSLTVEPVARFLNLELADDPIYDGFELQWFDDPIHGTGMLVFLSRRVDRTVDYYHEAGLRLDRSGYAIGGGTGAWIETHFDVARLDVVDDGVDAEIRFTDVDGRLVEFRVDDRDGRRRRRGNLLAPVSSGIEHPTALLLVWLCGFDLVRSSGAEPVVRIDGRDASAGRLPGVALHHRRLIKYAAPLCSTRLNPNHDGPVEWAGQGGWGEIDSLKVDHDGHISRFQLDPPFPDLTTLPDGVRRQGGWRIDVDGHALTGGRWSVRRAGEHVHVGLDVEQRWKSGRLPWLMWIVTRVVPVFRRWPTTYRWRATVVLGADPIMTSAWERTTTDRGGSYRRITGSSSQP